MMKSKKSKVFAVLAAAAVFTGVFAGCADTGTQTNPNTTTSGTTSAGTTTSADGTAVLAAMQAAQEEQADYNATAAMDIQMTLAGQAANITMNIDTQQKGDIIYMNMDMDAAGMPSQTETYIVRDGAGQGGTMYVNQGGTWTGTPVTAEQLGTQTSSVAIAVPEGVEVTNAGSGQFNGQDATVLEYTLTGDALVQELMSTQSGITAEAAEGVRDLSLAAKIYVDPETNLPLGTEVDMTEAYSQLMGSMYPGQTVEVTTAKTTITFNAWGTNVSNIVLPDGITPPASASGTESGTESADTASGTEADTSSATA